VSAAICGIRSATEWRETWLIIGYDSFAFEEYSTKKEPELKQGPGDAITIFV
jgi:hypothetical protein